MRFPDFLRRPAKSLNPNYAGAALVLLVLVGFIALFAQALYRQTIAAFDREVANLTLLLEEQTATLFKNVELTLFALRESDLPNRPPFDPATSETFRQRLTGLAYVRAIYMLDANGRLVQDSDPSHPTDLSDRAYFQEFKDDPKRDALVGDPVFSRQQNLWSIPVAVRLAAPSGGFAGVLVASVDPLYLHAFYRRIDLGSNPSIALFDPIGRTMLVSRLGDEESLDFAPREVPDIAVLRVGQRTNIVEAENGNRRIVAYRLLPDLSLGVSVGISMRVVLGHWWSSVWPLLVAAALMAGLVIWLAFVLDRREKEREQMARRAVTTQKLEALGQMTSGIAHDFNNVLAVAGASLRLIAAKGPNEEIMAATRDALARGEGLVRQLLAFARRQELSIERHDLNALVTGLESMLKHASGQGNRLSIALADGPLPCLTDRTQFDAAVVNLVVNACHAMPEPGEIRVETGRETVGPGSREGIEPGRYGTLAVTDQGSGMDEATLARIFEPFFTTKGEGGTGLGLSQIYGFMKQARGGITVASRPGRGSTFRLYFRIVEET